MPPPPLHVITCRLPFFGCNYNCGTYNKAQRECKGGVVDCNYSCGKKTISKFDDKAIAFATCNSPTFTTPICVQIHFMFHQILSEFGHIYHGKSDQPPSEQKQFAIDNWINSIITGEIDSQTISLDNNEKLIIYIFV